MNIPSCRDATTTHTAISRNTPNSGSYWPGRWTCDSIVVEFDPGRRTIGRLVMGLVTVFERAYHLGT